MATRKICNAKGTESKWAGKKERKGGKKENSERVVKFWLMHMYQIESLLQIFVPNLQEIHLGLVQNSLFSKA